MRRSLTASTVTLALLGASFYAAPANAVAATDDRVTAVEQRAPKKQMTGNRSPAIVSPDSGQRVMGHTTQVTVRAPYGVRTARLNKTTLRSDEFVLMADGIRRSVKVSASHGLRHGRNTLRVRINKRYKGVVTKTVTFRVTGKRLLTGAGRDRRIIAGSGVTLQGTAKLHPSMRDRSTTHTWQIVEKPHGSNPTLLRPNSRKPRLKADLPGKYVLRNTANIGRSTAAVGSSAADTATVNVSSQPMVPFNAWTEDSAGTLGITVDGRFYPGNLPLSMSAWQLLILDRQTLGVAEGDNRTYSWVAGTWYVADKPTQTAQQMRKANLDKELGELGPHQLVVLVHRSQFGQTIRDNTPFVKALNIPEEAIPTADQSAAIVAVPGKFGGVHTYMRDTAGKADLSGYMMQDSNFNYTFVDDARIPFDTRSGQTCDAGSCTVKVAVGGKDSGYPATERSFTVTNKRAGLAVMRFDRRTLAFRDSQFVYTNGVSADNIRDNMVGATDYLKSLPDDDLVFITSVSAPGAVLMGKPSPIGPPTEGGGVWVHYDPATELGKQIARFGGTMHRFLQAGVAADDGYTLVGHPGLQEGQGNESHTTQARLSGVLERDSTQMFTVKAVAPGDENYDTLTATVMSPPNTNGWWRANDPAFMAVFQCLAKNKEGMNKNNPRLSYWNSIKTIKTEAWNTWSLDVKRAQPSECPETTDTALFKDARNTFADELMLVYKLRRYLDVLKEPYGNKAAIQALANVSKWSSELKASSDEVNSRNVSIDWFDLIATALEVVAPFLAGYIGDSVKKAAEKLAEEATHAISAAIAGSIEFSMGKVESNEAGEKYLKDDEFTVEVGKLGSEVVSRLQDTVANFDAIAAVIAADYDKLSSIGAELDKCAAADSAGLKPGDAGYTCDPSFAIYGLDGEKAQALAEVAASHTAESTIYEKVLPLTYPMSRIPWDGVRTQGDGTPEGNWNGKLFTCYIRAPFPDEWPDDALPFLRRSLGQVHDPARTYLLGFDGFDERAGYRTPQFDVYVISAGGNRYNIATAEETVERLFGENIGSTDPKKGGLGADRVDYVLSQIQQRKIVDFPLSCGGFSDGNTEPAPLDR